jgi:hypothetical protein
MNENLEKTANKLSCWTVFFTDITDDRREVVTPHTPFMPLAAGPIQDRPDFDFPEFLARAVVAMCLH